MIKYAGVNTLIPTPEVEEFISRFLNEEYMRFWYEPGHGPDVGASAPVVPRLNWKRTFQPRLNQLIWPTGASRWASMLLLVTSEQLTAIKLLSDPSVSSVYRSSGQQLVIADATFQGDIEDDAFTREVLVPAEGETPASYGKSVALSTEMFALEARPVSLPYQYQFDTETEEWAWVETTEKTLWLLPIVDKRWFGQWFSINDESWETWDDVLTAVLSPFGTEVVSTIHADYGDPDADLRRGLDYANLGEIADSVSRTVGHRVSRRIDGTMVSMSPGEAETAWDNNFSGDDNDAFEVWRRIAGGDYTDRHKAAATIPEKIRTIFLTGSSIETTAEDAGATQWGITGTVVDVFPCSTGGTAENDFALQTAKDYVSWLSKKSDVVFSGVKAWRITGYEDFVQWSVNAETGITTRVVTHPSNLAMLPIGGGPAQAASGEFVKIYTLAIRGTADGGTIDWEGRKTAIVDDVPTVVTETGTWDFDSDESDIQTSLVGFDSGVLVIGGDIRWNVCKIKLSDPTASIRITATSMTREEHGITPQAELSWCYENENAWWE